MIFNRGLYCVFAMLLSVSLLGCNKQPEVTSPEAMNLIKQFYTAVNSKNEKRLSNSEAELQSLIDSKKISEAEIAAFEEIRKLARSGDWETAQKRALSFAEAQVR
ncbi:MAG: hypothetical protein U0930_14345 [Pirellulales bacterium]